MGLLIGIGVAAGALFLGWLFLKSRANAQASGAGAQGPGGGLFDTAANFIGMGNALAHNITTTGEQIAQGAIGITNESVNSSARIFSSVVNTGGNILQTGAGLGKQIAATTGSAVRSSITAPLAAIPPIAGGVKDAGTAIYHGGEKVVSGIGSAAGAVGSTVSKGLSTLKFW